MLNFYMTLVHDLSKLIGLKSLLKGQIKRQTVCTVQSLQNGRESCR